MSATSRPGDAVSAAEALFAYVGAFVDELARSGVQHVCIAPGSRSAPLALMFARHPEIRVWMHLDERSAAFFALGLAKASGDPVAVVCTSGSAAANFLPAVVEARAGGVPLVVLTADRPPELRDVGAPQTIDQTRLFGVHAKWFAEVALPEATVEMLRYVRTLACRAVGIAVASPVGPVHLNVPFREPLIPRPFAPPVAPDEPGGDAWHGRVGVEPYVWIDTPPRTLDLAAARLIAGELRRSRRPLIVCGPQADPALPAALGVLASAIGAPLLADPLSLVRCGSHSRGMVIDAYDAFLRDRTLADRFSPDLVLRIGGVPTSKVLQNYLVRQTGARQLTIGDGAWSDPTLIAAQAVQAVPRHACTAVFDILTAQPDESRRDPGTEWSERWRAADGAAREALARGAAAYDEPFEGRVFAELADLLPDGATLYVSSSMPVRDLDSFVGGSARRLRFLANRGANGIDGVVSSAMGAAAAGGGPTVLAIGDLAFYHDMNGLLAARAHDLSLTIVLINNDGGGIFSFLPQAELGDGFETLFGTPHGLDFSAAARLYGAHYTRVWEWDELRSAVDDGMGGNGLTIVELRTDRARNVEMHRELWHAASAAAAAAVGRDA